MRVCFGMAKFVQSDVLVKAGSRESWVVPAFNAHPRTLEAAIKVALQHFAFGSGIASAKMRLRPRKTTEIGDDRGEEDRVTGNAIWSPRFVTVKSLVNRKLWHRVPGRDRRARLLS